eukprot:COSAG05_NODE_4688_length_1408_cov_1.627196_1_plen_58_part_10
MVYQIWLNTCYRGVAGQVATAHEVASRGGRAARGCGYGALLLLAPVHPPSLMVAAAGS